MMDLTDVYDFVESLKDKDCSVEVMKEAERLISELRSLARMIDSQLDVHATRRVAKNKVFRIDDGEVAWVIATSALEAERWYCQQSGVSLEIWRAIHSSNTIQCDPMDRITGPNDECDADRPRYISRTCDEWKSRLADCWSPVLIDSTMCREKS